MFIDSPSTLCATPGFERQCDYEATFAQDDVFVADDLPDFAKSSILPRKMKKEAVEARMKEVFNHEQDEDGEIIREKSFDNFKHPVVPLFWGQLYSVIEFVFDFFTT